MQCVLQFIPMDVHGDDRLGPGQYGTLNHIQAHAARADNHHAATGLNLGSVDDRSHPGGHAAAD